MTNGLTIRMRLILVMGLLAAMLITGAAVGLIALSRANTAMNHMYADRVVALGQLDSVVRSLNRAQLDLAAAVAGDPAAAVKATDKVEAEAQAMAAAWAQYKATQLTDKEAQLAQDFEARLGVYRNEVQAPIVKALRDGKLAEAGALLQAKIEPVFAPIRQDINALIQLQLDVSKEVFAASQSEYQFVRLFCLGGLLVGLLIAAGAAALLVRAIVTPLDSAVAMAEAIAAGNLTYELDIASRDEMGRLMTALRAMQGSLASIVGKVRGGTETIATASAQIASGNLDLSARTESQASSLEETASSMEELTSTVKQNADNARQANALAQSASELAGRGGAVVADVVTTMASINQSSTRIVDIIGVIDGIAFQTNILALNAAVEAARAGEQGRGFAVVASEVRSLAQRSAAAAKEIKTLIDDSVSQVEGGTRLVDEAGATMRQIVDGIRRVADIMAEITAASGEQTAGIEQVNEAIAQMDEATQQNASLVEEAAAAAAAMQDQAAELARLVSVFQVSQQATAAVVPLRRPALTLQRASRAA